MKIYVVEETWASDYESGSDTKLYNTLSKAKESFNEKVKNAKIDLEYLGEEKVEEEDDNYYEIYENGYHSRNHITIQIKEMEVE